MVSSFSSPDCRRVQKFTRASLLVPKDEESNGFDVGSSGTELKNPSNTFASGLLPADGSGFSVVKNEKISDSSGLSLGTGPGISMSRPLLINEGACTAPQSDVTNPSNPASWRRILISVSGLPQA